MSIIKYVYKYTIAIEILDGSIYILRTNNIPKIFDLHMNVVELKNVNYWLKTKTGFTYEQITDMASIYREGLDNSYSLSDIKIISRAMIKATKDAIFKTDLVSEFASLYWVELLDINKLNKFIEYIRNDFDQLLKKYGRDEFFNILCRLWQFSNVCHPDKMYVFESMIKKRLGLTPKLPQYPDTSEAEQIIEDMVFGIIFTNRYHEYKNISDQLIKIVEEVNDGAGI